MKSKLVLPRRTVLRGLGGVALSLPLFSSLGCTPEEQRAIERISKAQQRAGEFPKRFVFVYTPNGSYEPPTPSFDSYWNVLSPLADKISIVKNVDIAVADLPPGEPHQSGMAMLTGRSLNPGDFIGGDGSHAGWASGISVDQEIAKHIGAMTKRPTLNLGVQSTNYGGTEVRTVLSYLGSDIPVPNETNPWVVFDALFSDMGMDPAGAARLAKRRQSVLDAVGKRYEALLPRLSSEDRQKLDQHLTSVREVETRLDKPTGVLEGACQLPTLAESPAMMDQYLGDPSHFAEIGRMQMDLLAMSFACDLTRVATLQWSAAVNNRPYPWLLYKGAPILDDEHGLSHQPDSATDAWGKLAVIREWNLKQLRYLLERLAAIPEGDGTMLDNTLVVMSSEIVRGNTHSHLGQHFLFAGGAGGAVKTGQFLDLPTPRNHNDLLVTILHAMGIEATSFGDPAFNAGPVTELLA